MPHRFPQERPPEATVPGGLSGVRPAAHAEQLQNWFSSLAAVLIFHSAAFVLYNTELEMYLLLFLSPGAFSWNTVFISCSRSSPAIHLPLPVKTSILFYIWMLPKPDTLSFSLLSCVCSLHIANKSCHLFCRYHADTADRIRIVTACPCCKIHFLVVSF